MICLDTNAAIAAINMRSPRIRSRLIEQLVDGVTVGIPVIVLFELWYGIWKSDRAETNARALATFLTLDLALWSFEPDDAEEARSIRAALERAGTPIGPYDILIAAQARRRGATLVTANRREFDRIPSLKVVDWTRE
jgi:tRNA(fMet)-specific endonuclease VapC